jgi:hypothetical protein
MSRAELHTLTGALDALVEELRRKSGGRLGWLRPLADLGDELRALDPGRPHRAGLRRLCDRARALFEGGDGHGDFARQYWTIVDGDPALGAADAAWASALAWASGEPDGRDGA